MSGSKGIENTEINHVHLFADRIMQTFYEGAELLVKLNIPNPGYNKTPFNTKTSLQYSRFFHQDKFSGIIIIFFFFGSSFEKFVKPL